MGSTSLNCSVQSARPADRIGGEVAGIELSGDPDIAVARLTRTSPLAASLTLATFLWIKFTTSLLVNKSDVWENKLLVKAWNNGKLFEPAVAWAVQNTCRRAMVYGSLWGAVTLNAARDVWTDCACALRLDRALEYTGVSIKSRDGWSSRT